MDKNNLDYVAHDLALKQLPNVNNVDNEILVESYINNYTEIKKILDSKRKEKNSKIAKDFFGI